MRLDSSYLDYAANGVDHQFQRGTLLAQSLRTLLIVPDLRDFQLALYLGQLLTFGIVVKGTPSRLLDGLACP